VSSMSERCNCCRKWEEHIHLNGLIRHKFHFFKVLLGDFSHQLSIPRKFVFLFHEKLPETVDLKDPLGKRWHVKLKKAEDYIFLEDGWEEFVRDHSLEVGDFLVFRFSGDSCLNVLIFDASGCEKESLYACEKQNKGHACDDNPMRGVGREDCAAIQLVPFPTRAAGFDNVQAAQPQTIDVESDDCPEMVRQVVKEETYSLNDEQEVPPEQTVPIAFASEFFSGHSCRITLRTPAGKWGLRGAAYGMNYRICHGWKEFVTGNNLQEGDVLIFEFASWRSHEHMNVRIFRVVEDAVAAAVVDATQ
ncbi:hypothetical protein Taro_006280, partial [Colocasia esculenta]|nr:hypothetical protein [Colocasia esculenta]